MTGKSHGRRLYNPFPRPPSELGLIEGGTLLSHLPPCNQIYASGKDFLLKYDPRNGGSICALHRSNPSRKIWSTNPGHPFAAAARGSERVEECRGSFAMHDSVSAIYAHQTLERIHTVTGPDLFVPGKEAEQEGAEGKIVVITGCLYQSEKEAKGKANNGVPYCLCFSQKRDHELGFHLSLGHASEKEDEKEKEKEALLTQGSNPGLATAFANAVSDCTTEFLEKNLWLWSRRPLSAFSKQARFYTGKYMLLVRRTIWGLISRSHKGSLRHRGYQQHHHHHRLELQSGINSKLHKLEPGGSEFNRVVLSYQTEASERFFGFGEQFSYFDMKGRRVPILVQEQGIGRGDQPITMAINLISPRSGGDWHTSYAPVPFYITSQSRSVFLEGYNYSVFDMRLSDRVQIQVHGQEMKGRILHGRNPPEVIERYTESIGRMRELPPWILRGAIVGLQGGTEPVRKVWEKLQKHDVPVSAFWLQDWVGQRKTKIGSQLWWNWEVDDAHYSGWRQLLLDLRSKGIRTMTYLNPFIASTDEKPSRNRDLFREAAAADFLVSDEKGVPYMIPNTSFDAAMVDLTRPATRKWLKRLMEDMVETGVSGWMADFGESLPFNARVFSGESGASLHNRYPELWAELNREFAEEWEAKRLVRNTMMMATTKRCQEGSTEGKNERSTEEDEEERKKRSMEDEQDERLVFFVRAGYRNSPRWATLFWEGDQMVSWQRHDGIKSAVVGLLSSGICGFAFNHSDIGGYCTVDLPFLRYTRSEELLLRWMELNAFTTIFRTHEGNMPLANHQFHTNERSLTHFARFAKIYQAWEFYRLQLVKEASSTGMPVVRHLFLHYPHDVHVHTITYQEFLVGCEFLVVPSLDKGCNKVEAYFPVLEGGEEWQHIWSGKIYAPPPNMHRQGFKAWIDCPLGYPAVFFKKGSRIGQVFLQNLIDLGLMNF